MDGAVVASGQVSGAKAGGATFSNAVLDTLTLALAAPTAAPSGATLAIRVSVRVSCTTATSGLSSTARFWYDGQPIDTGRKKDAGSRFDATIGGANSNYFLRSNSVLATTAGTAKQSVDVAVNDGVACPNRPFSVVGTWSEVLP